MAVFGIPVAAAILGVKPVLIGLGKSRVACEAVIHVAFMVGSLGSVVFLIWKLRTENVSGMARRLLYVLITAFAVFGAPGMLLYDWP